MKLLIVLSILPLLTYSVPIEIVEVSEPLNLADIQLDDVSEDQTRTKRSGFDLGSLKQNLISQVSSASAGVVGGLSSGSGKAFGSSSGSGHSGGGSFDILSKFTSLSGASGSVGNSIKSTILSKITGLSSSASKSSNPVSAITSLSSASQDAIGSKFNIKTKLASLSGSLSSSASSSSSSSSSDSGGSGGDLFGLKAKLFGLSIPLSASSAAFGSSAGSSGSSGGNDSSSDFSSKFAGLSGSSSTSSDSSSCCDTETASSDSGKGSSPKHALFNQLAKLSGVASQGSSSNNLVGTKLSILSFLTPLLGASSSSLGGLSGSGKSNTDSQTSSDSYGPPTTHGNGFDGGDLKRNILNTLFQAVKAISGGIVGIKGQLIKGSGYLVSTKGKLISASGDQVSGVGNKITHSATLVPAGPSDGGKAQLFSLSSSLSGGSSGSSSGHSGSGGSGDFLGSITKLSGASSSKGTDAHDDTGSFTSFDTHGPPSVNYGTPDHTTYNVHSYHSAEPTYVPHQSYGPPANSHSSIFHDEPIYVTHGPSTFDSYDHSSSHHHSSSNLFEQKSQTIQQASDVLRTLINKLPEKDYHEGQHSIQTEVEISPSHEVGHHQESFIVPPFKPMTAQVPFNLNNLPVQPVKQSQLFDTQPSGVPPPPGADPSAYKIYRAMAHKLAGSKLTKPQSYRTSKKPYLILENFDQTQIFDAHHANSQQQQQQQQLTPDSFNMHKSINFEFAGPVHPQFLKRQHVPTEITKLPPIQKRHVKINVRHVSNPNKRPAS